MIVTLTPNPSVDRTLTIPALDRGEVNRSDERAQVDPGGKGINVVRALCAAGVPATAVIPVGGAEGQHLISLLTEQGITPVTVAIHGAVRANIALAEPDGTLTKINEAGPRLTPGEVSALLDAAVAAAGEAAWLVGSGSLPPGVEDDLWAQLILRGRRVGALTAIDTSGPPLLAALAAGPDLIKPNLEELAETVGRPLPTLGDAIDAAQELRRRGAGTVLASLGADGALLVTEGAVRFAIAHVEQAVSSVGAGDSMLAGYLAAIERNPADAVDALRQAVAYGAAAVQLPGSSLPTPKDLRPDDVRINQTPDPTRVLRTWDRSTHEARTSVS